MAYFNLHVVLILICIEIASTEYCDSRQVRFTGVQDGGSRLYLPGESFVPSCQVGYRHSLPNGRLVCENGVWRGHFPPCVVDVCNVPPPSIKNGKPRPSHKRDHFAKVEYTCDEHYFPVTASSVRCSFGFWVGTPPICKDGRCVFADLRHKEGIVSSSTNKTLSGNPLIFQCAPGFVPAGAPTPLCTRGTWVEYGISPCKEDDCIIPDVRHGSLMEVDDREVFKWKKLRRENKTVLKKVKKGSSVPAGRKFEIVCDSKHSFEGKGSKSVPTVCGRGMWNPKPSCIYKAHVDVIGFEATPCMLMGKSRDSNAFLIKSMKIRDVVMTKKRRDIISWNESSTWRVDKGTYCVLCKSKTNSK